MIFSGPIFVIAFLAIAHLIISGEETFEKYATGVINLVSSLNFVSGY